MNNLERDILFAKGGSDVFTRTLSDGSIHPDITAIQQIGGEVTSLHDENNIVLPYSGAIPTGMALDGIKEVPDKTAEDGIAESQRYASNGNRILVNHFADALGERTTGQIGNMLLTRHELDPRYGMPERKEALRTLKKHFLYRDIVLINENDAIAHDEITFGDNDILTAMLAEAVKKSEEFSDNVKVVFLTQEVDGVYEDENDSSTLIRTIDDIDQYLHVIGENKSSRGSGGMASKFEAAEILTKADVDVWVAKATEKNAIQRAMNGEIGTHFTA